MGSSYVNGHQTTMLESLPLELIITYIKRALLSIIAKTYDVTRMLAPLIFWTKALMQNVWSLGLDWDTPLPSYIQIVSQTAVNIITSIR